MVVGTYIHRAKKEILIFPSTNRPQISLVQPETNLSHYTLVAVSIIQPSPVYRVIRSNKPIRETRGKSLVPTRFSLSLSCSLRNSYSTQTEKQSNFDQKWTGTEFLPLLGLSKMKQRNCSKIVQRSRSNRYSIISPSLVDELSTNKWYRSTSSPPRSNRQGTSTSFTITPELFQGGAYA